MSGPPVVTVTPPGPGPAVPAVMAPTTWNSFSAARWTRRTLASTSQAAFAPRSALRSPAKTASTTGRLSVPAVMTWAWAADSTSMAASTQRFRTISATSGVILEPGRGTRWRSNRSMATDWVPEDSGAIRAGAGAGAPNKSAATRSRPAGVWGAIRASISFPIGWSNARLNIVMAELDHWHRVGIWTGPLAGGHEPAHRAFGQGVELLEGQGGLQASQHALQQAPVDRLAGQLAVLFDQPAEPGVEPRGGHGLLEQGQVPGGGQANPRPGTAPHHEVPPPLLGQDPGPLGPPAPRDERQEDLGQEPVVATLGGGLLDGGVERLGPAHGRTPPDIPGHEPHLLQAAEVGTQRVRVQRQPAGHLPDRDRASGQAQVPVQAEPGVVGEDLVDLQSADVGHGSLSPGRTPGVVSSSERFARSARSESG